MFSLRKPLLTLVSLLGASQLFTIRPSVYFAFLVRFQNRSSNASPPTVANRRQYGAFLFFKALLYLAIVAAIQSGLSCAFLKLKGHPFFGFQTVDPLLVIITAKYAAANVFFVVGISLFGVFIFYIDYGLSLGLDTYLASLIYQVICENVIVSFKLNTYLQKVPPIKNLFLHPWNGFTQIRRLGDQLWNPPLQLTFARSRLAGFPYLSKQTRSRLVRPTLVYEHTFAVAALTLAPVIGLYVVIMMNILCSDVSLSFAIAVYVESFFLALIAWHTVVFMYFIIQGLLLFTFLTRSHLKEMNNNLAILLAQLKKNRVSNGSHLLERQLGKFFTQHRSLANIQATFNEKMVSRFFLIAFFSNLLFQVVQLNILLLENLGWEEKLVCLVLSIAQTELSLRIIRQLISWTDSLYSSSSLLLQAQGILLRSTNRFTYPATVASKLKLMTYIERLCTKKKARFTVGPLGAISSRSLYEFFFAYSGFFIYVTSLMRKWH